MTAGGPSASPPETTSYFRPAGLDGVEALHASFVTHAYRPHSHPTWTVATMERGAARFTLDDSEQRADDGELFVLEPESVHTGVAAVPGGWAYKVLYLDPALIGAWAEEGTPPQAARWVVFRDPALRAALRQAHHALAGDLPGLAVDSAVLRAVEALRPHLRPGPRVPRTRRAAGERRGGMWVLRSGPPHARVQAGGRGSAGAIRKIVQDSGPGVGDPRPRWR